MRELVTRDNFIGAWFIEDLSICDDLIKYFDTSDRISPGYVGIVDSDPIIDLQTKSCTECLMSWNDDVVKRYGDALSMVCEEYKKRYTFCDDGAPWSIIEGSKIQKYNPGDGYYAWHFERDSMRDDRGSRHLVFLTYLNDVTDQGETEFYYQGLKVKPQKGLTLIWPADWTYTHRGVPSMSQTKYIVTGWYNYTK
jgi:prolyl 4-hydroxylase